MSKDVIPSWFEEFRDRILASLEQAAHALQAGAVCYCEALDRDPAFREWIQEEHPLMDPGVWRRLEKAGRGLIDVRVVCGTSYAARLERLTLAEQRQALDGTLPLLTSTGDTLQVKLACLMPPQADQVFARDHIRSLPEQRAFIEERKAAALMKRKPATESTIRADKKKHLVYITGEHVLTRVDLIKLLEQVG